MSSYSADLRNPEIRAAVRETNRRAAVPEGHVRMTIPGHGSYQTLATSLEDAIERYADWTMDRMASEIVERQGNAEYRPGPKVTRIQRIMILNELDGNATA